MTSSLGPWVLGTPVSLPVKLRVEIKCRTGRAGGRFFGIGFIEVDGVRQRLLGLWLALVCTVSGPAFADAHLSEDELVRRVTDSVMRALEKDGRLQQIIESGIDRYVEKRRKGQTQARNAALRERAKSVRPVSPGRDHILGSSDAMVSLVEYSDFECPYCKRFHVTARAVLDSYGGLVNWVYRHFPLEFHNPHAKREAEASECAAEQGGNEAFWRYADALYARTRSNKGFPLAALVPMAVEFGLDGARFEACLTGGQQAARVTEDHEEGLSIGITGTPGSVLLNNKTGEVRVVSRAVPLARLRRTIDELLAGNEGPI